MCPSSGSYLVNNTFLRIRNTETTYLGSPAVNCIYLDDQLSGHFVYGNKMIDSHQAILLGGGRRHQVCSHASHPIKEGCHSTPHMTSHHIVSHHIAAQHSTAPHCAAQHPVTSHHIVCRLQIHNNTFINVVNGISMDDRGLTWQKEYCAVGGTCSTRVSGLPP